MGARGALRGGRLRRAGDDRSLDPHRDPRGRGSRPRRGAERRAQRPPSRAVATVTSCPTASTVFPRRSCRSRAWPTASASSTTPAACRISRTRTGRARASRRSTSRASAELEVWNGGCEREIARGGSEPHWDDALQRGRHLFGLAADDSHHPGHDSDLAWTWIRAVERTPDAVLDALRTGAFYASAGPAILDVVAR